MKMSTGVAAIKMPDSPPMINMDTKDTANSIAVVNWIFPPQIVPSQLKTFTALGNAINMVETMKFTAEIGVAPIA